MERNWRGRYNVFVPQADAFGAIAVIRSLGEQGYIVHAGSSDPAALGLKSNFANYSHITPEYSGRYVDWLRAFIKERNIHAIVPSEGFLLAIGDVFQEFANLLPISSVKEDVYTCLSKVDVFDAFSRSADLELHQNLTRNLVVKSTQDTDWQQLQQWRFPLFIKGDACHAKAGNNGFVKKAESVEEAKRIVEQQLNYYNSVLIQDFFDGEKVTVSLLYMEGKMLAESMVKAVHQNPHTGGLMSLRHSWWKHEIYEDAVRRMHLLKWTGAAMFEYRWNRASGEFSLIELNSRYWGALNLDILAGVHFPCYQMDCFLEKRFPKSTVRLKKEIIVRNALPADYGYTLSILRDKDIRAGKKIITLASFFLLFLHPAIKADLLYPGDRKLYFINFFQFTMRVLHSCLSRLRVPGFRKSQSLPSQN